MKSHDVTISRRALIGAGVSAALFRRLAFSANDRTPIVDTHVHLVRGLHRGERLEPAVDSALRAMDDYLIERAIVSPPPFPPGHRGLYGLKEITAAIRGQKRLAFAAGGDSLNPMVQSTAASDVSADVLRRFTDTAESIASAGAAGFGEFAVEHFSSGNGGHPYETAPPDHPLLLALADIAAKHAMPIDIHMEAVPQDMPFPANRPQGANPARLTANIEPFERLLDHNHRARIVWVHAGWDLTGERTVPLMHGLLERHTNLAMNIKLDRTGTPRTAPFSPDGTEIRPAWITLLRAFPDRFAIGSDQFVDQGTERFELVRHFVDALPDDIRSAVANGTAPQIYRLESL